MFLNNKDYVGGGETPEATDDLLGSILQLAVAAKSLNLLFLLTSSGCYFRGHEKRPRVLF